MKALWIGAGVGPETRQKILRAGGKLLSVYVSQTNLVEGMDALGLDMDTLNAMNVKESVMKTLPYEQWSRNGKNSDISVGYNNAKYINRLYKQAALCREAENWAKANRTHTDVTVFVYSMHTPFLAAAASVKRILPQTRICLIVPDLPQYMDMKMSPLKKVLKAIDWQRIRGYMKKVDRYVLYAEPMAAFLKLREGSWTVMEGSYDPSQMPEVVKQAEDGKISVMYSGVLDLRYGIPELLDAMKLLDDNFELWLTGDGNAVELIRQREKEDFRIQFFGYLPTRQDLLNKQAQATMLISPRKDTEEASRYCFPSKLFEYLASGRPVISCFLDGIPGEYHRYLYELPCVSAEEIARQIRAVAEIPEQERATAGKEAREFVLVLKNKYAQARKIVEFLGLIGTDR